MRGLLSNGKLNRPREGTTTAGRSRRTRRAAALVASRAPRVRDYVPRDDGGAGGRRRSQTMPNISSTRST